MGKVLNGQARTGLDQPVQSGVQSGPMVEIGLTSESGVLDLTGLGLVRPDRPSDKICTALKKLICFGSRRCSESFPVPLGRNRIFVLVVGGVPKRVVCQYR